MAQVVILIYICKIKVTPSLCVKLLMAHVNLSWKLMLNLEKKFYILTILDAMDRESIERNLNEIVRLSRLN